MNGDEPNQLKLFDFSTSFINLQETNSILIITIFGLVFFLFAKVLTSMFSFRNGKDLLHERKLKETSFENLKRTKEITVLSYNIFLRPPFVKNNADDFKNERLKGFLEEMKKSRFDIIALQEIFSLGNFRPNQLIKEGKKMGYHWYMQSVLPFPRIQKNFLDAGLMILSKYPIIEKDHWIYTRGNQIDSWVSKQVIYAKIQVSNDYYFHLFTTHMQASYLDSKDFHNKINDECRLVQIDEMCDFIHSKIKNSTYPALITGDFNVNARGLNEGEESEEYNYLIKKLNKDSESYSPDHYPVIDLLKAHNQGKHPNTYADVHVDEEDENEDVDKNSKSKLRARETILTHTADHCTQLCIDYMMFLDSKANKLSKKRIGMKENSTKVEEFFVKHIPCVTQLSDHYGVSTSLQYIEQDNIVHSKL